MSASKKSGQLTCYQTGQFYLLPTGLSLLAANGNISVTIKGMSFQIKELLKADGDSPFADGFGSLEG